MSDAAPRILLVDDEPMILEGLKLRLRRGYDVVVATSGPEALRIMLDGPPFDVVISDMRMPGMDGAAFLAAAAEEAPDTIRMLLTGQADLESAIAAINEGHIFRFLTKPLPPDQLHGALAAALEQRRLVEAEHVLLKETLAGSIRALTTVMAFTRPAAVGRAERVKRRLRALGEVAGEETWQAEMAATFSQKGSLLLSQATVDRYYAGEYLAPEEERQLARMPLVAADLLRGIPRLEGVCTMLTQCAGEGHPDTWAGRALRAVQDLDALEERGAGTVEALDHLAGQWDRYDPRIVELLRFVGADLFDGGAGDQAGECDEDEGYDEDFDDALFAALPGAVAPQDPAAPRAPAPQAAPRPRRPSGPVEVALHELAPGMVLAADVVDYQRRILLARGLEITAAITHRMAEMSGRIILGAPVVVHLPRED